MARKKLILNALVTSSVANLAISDTAKQALIASFVGSTDDVSRNEGFRTAVLAFGEALPADYKGKPLPQADADSMADAAAAAFEKSYGDLSGRTEDERKGIARMVSQKRSRAFSLFTCAPILPMIYGQGFRGTIQDTLKLCTALKDNEFSAAKAIAVITAEPVKNFPASIAMHMASLLNMKADDVTALNAKAKAQLVQWCDEYGIKAKHAEDYRNPSLARS